VGRIAGLAAGSAFTVCPTKGVRIMALTVKRHHRLVRAGKPVMKLDGPPNGVRGLYLVVEHKRNANWGLRFQIAGRTRWMGLGSALLGDGVSLDGAREKAKAARQQLRDKVDPLEQRAAERAAARVIAAKALTFKQAAESFIAQNEVGWKNPRHREQWTQTLKQYAYPIIGDLPVQAIDTGLVLKVIEPIWQTKTATASRLRGRIESVLAWATVRKYRSGDNPARWHSNLQHVLPNKSAVAKVEHHPALPYADMPAFVAKLKAHKTVAASALLFTIYTAARTQESVMARWSEIDLASKTWTVPASRMKAGKEHKVPLSDAAVALLRGLPREGNGDDGYLFVGRQPGTALNAKALSRLLARMGVAVTVHGFRAGFRTWAADSTSFAREIGEAALAHAIPDKVEASYKRTTFFDRRRQLMQAWSRFIASPPVQRREGDNIAPIGGAR
jgi:integrase